MKITDVTGTNFEPAITEVIGYKYKEGSSAIAPDWATGKDYLANQLVVNLSTLYRCLSDHTSTDFASNKSYWEELSGGESGGNGGGDIEKVLWEGTAGSTDATVVNSLINLSESVGNYDLLTIEFIAYSSANSAVRRPQRREFSVEQLKNLINTPSSINYGLQSVWGYGNYDDFVEITNLNGKTTLTTLDLRCKQAQITKVIGVKNSSLQIKDWESDKSYVQNQIVLNNNVMYRCIESHLSTTAFDSTKWQELNRGTGIEDVSYSLTNNTLTVKLTDGTEQSFNGLGINYFGGFAQTVLWEGNASSIETYNLSDTIDNYDLLLVKVGNLKTEIIAPAVLKSFRQSTFNPTGQWVATTDATFSGSKMNVTRVSENASGNMQPITKVIGIKGDVSDKVLWEGSVAVQTSSAVTTISLLDSIENYKQITIEGITNGSTAVKTIDTIPIKALLTNLGTYLCSANYGTSNGASMSLQPIDLENKDKLSFAWANVSTTAWGTTILVKRITGIK